jgi:hypothetical protein
MAALELPRLFGEVPGDDEEGGGDAGDVPF